jgi:ADP-ribosylglycohydrolase
MIGAIAGDIIGSVYEAGLMKSTDFPLFSPGSKFTDDTVLTVAVADCILHNKSYAATLKEYGRRYPGAGYGLMFYHWIQSTNSAPYHSLGNGSAMRVSPVGFAFSNLEEVLYHAEQSALVTHNHPEGIKGAQAIAAAVFLARTGKEKPAIAEYIENKFDYSLKQKIEEIRKSYYFYATCPGSVPQALISFLDSADYEDAVRKAISLGGDSDTLACMTGAIAQAYYQKVPEFIIEKVRDILDDRLLEVIDEFNEHYGL